MTGLNGALARLLVTQALLSAAAKCCRHLLVTVLRAPRRSLKVLYAMPNRARALYLPGLCGALALKPVMEAHVVGLERSFVHLPVGQHVQS